MNIKKLSDIIYRIAMRSESQGELIVLQGLSEFLEKLPKIIEKEFLIRNIKELKNRTEEKIKDHQSDIEKLISEIK